MRNRRQYYRPVCGYLGLLAGLFGALMLVPLAVRNFLAGDQLFLVADYPTLRKASKMLHRKS